MALEPPINALKLVAASNADDLSYVALADISKLAAETSMGKGYRLIGGHMVTLHARRWLLGDEFFRETTDADMGLHTKVVAGSAPDEYLERADYEKVSGSRFEKRVDGDSKERPTIDLLVPTYDSRARQSKKVGNLTTTEVRGLAFALNRPAIEVDLHMASRSNLRGACQLGSCQRRKRSLLRKPHRNRRSHRHHS